MKVLNPTVTIIIPSHMKPEWFPSSIESVLNQTRQDIQILVIDSGEWVHKTDGRSQRMSLWYETYSRYAQIEWYSLGEPPGLISRACPISYVVNEAIRHHLVRGKYVCIFTDDDLYRPEYIERMAGFLDAHPAHRAVWCSQDRIRVDGDGVVTPDPLVIHADAPRHGASFDNKVDMLQLMFHRSILDEIGDPWLDEDPADTACRHSDGRFMDKIGVIAGTVPNIPEVLVTHRYTPISTYN